MPTTDLQTLVVQLSADVKRYENQLAKTAGVTTRQLNKIEKRAREMDERLSNVGRNAFRGLIGSAAALSSALSIREVTRYADAWTEAENKISAASQIAGRQGRTLEELNKIATATRSGITETADLYAKLLRSTADVAESEIDVARATEIVNKAFKAGGAAASEQAAGILQFAQGLGSGVLQGDELRSIRENAPMIAQAIAQEFDTTIAGIKELGAEGELTTDRVFKAILNSGAEIEKAFAKTNQTIGDGITRVNNAFTQYIGQTDDSLRASDRLVAGLNALADNFDQTADTVLQLAGVIAGALVGRSLAGMLRTLGLAGTALVRFGAAVRTASGVSGLSAAFGGLSAAAGPLGLILGGTVAVALMEYSRATAEAATQSEKVNAELERLGLIASEAAPEVDKVSDAIDNVTDGEKYRKLKLLADEYDRLKGGGDWLGLAALGDELGDISATALQNVRFSFFNLSEEDANAYRQIANLADELQRGNISSAEVVANVKEIAATDVSQEVVDLANTLARTATILDRIEPAAEALELDDALAQLENYKTYLQDVGDTTIVSEDQKQQLLDIIEKFEKNKLSAEQAADAMLDVGEANLNATAYIQGLVSIISTLNDVRDAAIEAKTTFLEPVTVATGLTDRQISAYETGNEARREGEAMLRIGKNYADELERQNSLTKDELALEKERAEIRKRIEGEGGFLPETEIDRLARSSLAARERRSASASGGGKTEDEYTRTVNAILQRKAALEAETAAQAALNPYVNDYGFSLEKARAAQDLLTRAEEAGLEITPALRESIDQLSEGYAMASAEAAKAAEASAKMAAAVDDVRQTGKDALGGFISDLVEGESAADALGNALGRIGDKLLDLSLNSLFGTGPGIGGFFSALSGSSFRDGGAVRAATGGRIDATGGGRLSGPGGPRGDKIPAWLSDGEYVVNSKAAKQNYAALEAMNSGLKMANGGYVGYNLPSLSGISAPSQSNAFSLGGISITMPEGTSASDAQAVGMEVRKQLEQFSRYTLPERVRQIQRNPNRRG